MPARLDIQSTVDGLQSLEQLESKIESINNKTRMMNNINQRASLLNKIDIANLAQRNKLLMGKLNLSDQEITKLAAQLNFQEKANFQIKERIVVEQEALQLRRLFAGEGIRLSLEEARTATMANRQIIQSEQELAAASMITRRALMQASISLFVMNISANQLVSSLKPLVEGNEEATQAIENFQVVLNLALGPMQAYMAMLQIMQALQIGVARTAMMMGAAMGSAFFWMMALTSQSRVLRVVFGALAGVFTAIAIKSFIAALANMIQATSLATLQAVLGSPKGFAAIAAGLAITGIAVGSLSAMRPKAQTVPGQQKFVKRGGIAEVDTGERILRDTADGRDGMGGIINIFLPESYTGSVAQSRQFANETNRLLRSGKATIKTKRVSVSGT